MSRMTSTPRAAGQRHHRGGKVLGLVVDRPLGAEALARQALFGGAGRRKHARAECARHLNRRRADAARAAVNEKRLARPQPPALEDIRPDREERFRHRRGRHEIDGRWNRQALHVGRDAVLGVTAARYERAHLVPFAPALHAWSARGDGARHLEAGNVAGARRRRIFAFALHQVRAIDAGSGDADQHLARPRARQRHLDRLKDVRTARLGDTDGNHYESRGRPLS